MGSSGGIIKTINGGTSWSPQSSGTGDLLYGVHFPNIDTGYAVGQLGTIVKTTDGGTNWATQTSGTTDDLHSVYFVNTNTGYV
ncbi:MAG: hypothetical protein IIA88_02395, partial [Bacteroidetes bacterium]|nr:hypothetical protein [Bacteroidota bacterium]